MGSTIKSEIYEQIMSDERVPSPKGVALEILKLTQTEGASAADIGRVVETDPAISARLIKTVNAPLVGVRNQIASVDQAITLLGFRAVSAIAVAFSVVEENRSGLPEFDYDAYWSESLAKACSMRKLAAQTKVLLPAEGLTHGLLSGIGRLALASVFPDRYRDVLLTLGDASADEMAQAELAVFEVDAETLSAFMLKEWGMPA